MSPPTEVHARPVTTPATSLLCFLSEWNIEISDLCTNLVMDLNATETDADFARLKKKHDPHFAECLEYTVVNLLERYMQSTYGTKIAQKLANS